MSTFDAKTLVAIAAGGAIGAVTAIAASRYLAASTSSGRPESGALQCLLRWWLPDALDHSLPPPVGSVQSATGAGRGGAEASGSTAGPSVAHFEEDEILQEQFTRNVQFFGAEGQSKVAGSFVVIIGLGVQLLPVPVSRR